MDNDALTHHLKEDVDLRILSASSIVEKENHLLNLYKDPLVITLCQELIILLKNNDFGKKNVVISISHDNYSENFGGIQKCLQVEEKASYDHGDDYLHIYPTIPRTWIVDDSISSEIPLCIRLNGKKIATTTSVQLINAFKDIVPNVTSMIVHSPLGFKLTDIINIYINLPKKPKFYFWLHDFTTLCSNFNLLRNSYTYCEAPSIDSTQCDICVAKTDRQKQLPLFADFFKKTNPVILSPSKFMENYWINHVDYQYAEIKTVEHYSFGKDTFSQNNNNGDLKIAFLGFPAYHKGWNDFIELIENLHKENSHFSFYVFSKEAPKSELYQHIVVTNNENYSKGMKAELIINEIDIAFIGSIWPETFCLTAYEAFAADTFLVANYLSGNVVDLIKNNNNGYIYRGLNDLITYLEDKKNQQKIYNRRSKKHYKELIASKMTYS